MSREDGNCGQVFRKRKAAKKLQRTQMGHQRQLQGKSEGLAEEDGTPSSQWYIAQLSELRLVYHESVRRKWVAKYQIDAP